LLAAGLGNCRLPGGWHRMAVGIFRDETHQQHDDHQAGCRTAFEFFIHGQTPLVYTTMIGFNRGQLYTRLIYSVSVIKKVALFVKAHFYELGSSIFLERVWKVTDRSLFRHKTFYNSTTLSDRSVSFLYFSNALLVSSWLGG
jgi:hypothetical protein